jgi:hypothetical protein
MVLAQPHCDETMIPYRIGQSDGIHSLKLSIVIPAHYGQIHRAIVGDERPDGFQQCSATPAPVSLDTGMVYIHIQPLLPTNLQRDHAVELCWENCYQVVNLYSFRSVPRAFTSDELSRVQSGCVVTLKAAATYHSLEEFHEVMRQCRVVDYWTDMRYVVYQREEVELEMMASLRPFSAQVEAINGRRRTWPQLETDAIEPSALPFMEACPERDKPFFPWRHLRVKQFPRPWGIGSRGLTDERPYADVVEEA